MTLQDKVPVEPIAPERLERLERRIVAAAGPVLARPRRPSLWPVGLALAGAAAGAIAVYALRPAPPAPSVTAPIAVSTDGDRGATLALGDASIAAAPDTKYDVVRAGGGVDVRLDHGAVRLDVAPRKDRPPLWVHAGDVGVRVVGTAFTVTRAPEGDVSVEVEHGTVEVHKAGAVAPVTGGQRWSSRDGTVIAIAPKPDAADATPGAGSASGGGASASGDGRIGANSTHTGDLATGPAIDVAVLSDRDRPTVAPGAGSGSSRVTPRTGGKPGSGTGAGSGASAPDVSAETPGDLAAEIRKVALPAGTSETSGSIEERVTVLRTRFAKGQSAEAAAALYTLARLQFVEQGKRADALKSLDQYETRFPNGAERDDAMWLRIRILCERGYSDACRAAAHSYVKAFAKDYDLDLDAQNAPLRARLANRITKQP